MKQDKGKFLVDREVAQVMIRSGQEMCDYGAYIYLLSEAAYMGHMINYEGKHIHVKRGQVPKSIRRIAEELKWSTGRVRRFLKKLEDAGHITTATNTGFTIITFCNYEENQSFNKSVSTPLDTPQRTNLETTPDTNANTYPATNITNITNKLKQQTNKKTEDIPKWKEFLKEDLGIHRYGPWIAPLEYQGGHLLCPTEAIFNWCINNYTQKLEVALSMNGLEFKGLILNPDLKVVGGG